MLGKYGLMKRFNGMTVILILIFFTLQNAMAREDTFKEEDFQNLIKAASEKLKNKTYRFTKTSVVYENGNSTPVKTEKIIREAIPPDREYYVSETETPEGIKRYEYIHIGNKRYVRNNNGRWVETSGFGTGFGFGSGKGIGSGVKIETTFERKLNKGEIIDNQKADYYETVITTKFIYPTKTYTNIRKVSYWFYVDGMPIKSLTEDQNDEEKRFTRTTEEYEYKSNIKIEAPIK